jgi:hypothetical protein
MFDDVSTAVTAVNAINGAVAPVAPMLSICTAAVAVSSFLTCILLLGVDTPTPTFPAVSKLKLLLLMTSFVVVLYVKQLAAVSVTARIGFTKNALAVDGAKFAPDAFRMMELAPWLLYPAPNPSATELAPWFDQPASRPTDTA